MPNFISKLPFTHHKWFMYLRLLIGYYTSDDCPQKAASLTYTTLLALVPIITVLIVVFSVIPALANIREQLQTALFSNLLPSSSATIREYFDTFTAKSSNLGLLGILGLFVTTIMTLITIEEAFNKIWRVHETPSKLASILRYWTMITLAPIVLGVAFGASSAISGLSLLNQKIMGYGIDWAIWAQILSFVVMTAGFIGMYWFIPRAQVPIKNATIAGIIIATLFEALRSTFGIVMTNFTSYEAIYGAFAALPVFLLWIYLSWNVILLGVEISYTLTIFDAKDVPVRHPLLSLLDMLNLTYKAYQRGATVTQSELRATLGRRELPKWHLYIHELVSRELITHTKDDHYILRTDLDSISLWEFYKQLPYPLPIKDELDKLERANYDPWFTVLYDELVKIEQTAKSELSMSLADMFRGTPVRQKEQVLSLTNDSDTTSDSAGYDAKARTIINNQGDTTPLPAGDSVLNEHKFTRITHYIKKGWQRYQQGKKQDKKR